MIVLTDCWHTLSFSIGIALLVVASHVSCEFVLGFVLDFHFVANPFCMVPIMFIVPEAAVLVIVGVYLALFVDFAVKTGVWSVQM